MQLTETYKLNLIEPSDPFSPDGLNQNTRKVEEVLKAREAVNDGKLAEMNDRVTALEAHRMVVGTYVGTGRDFVPRFVYLGFTPSVVCVSAPDNIGTDHWGFATDQSSSVTVVEGGFTVGYTIANSMNETDRVYPFLAFY